MHAAAAPWRGRPSLTGGLVASVLAHAALLALVAWPAASTRPMPKPAPPGRVALMWLTAARPAAAPAPLPPAARAGVRKARRVAAVALPARAQPVATARAAEPRQPAEPISGAVFGLPTIGYGGSGAARWMRARAEPPATPAAPLAPPQALAQTVQDAGRAQIALVLQQKLAALPPPAEGGDGRCALHDDRDTPLACDSEPLQRALQADAAALSNLLQAYRGMDPRIAGVALAFTHGLYRLELR
jgi:hypothetical protein